MPQATAAAGAVLAYLADNQKAALANVRDLTVYNPSRYLVLDASARRHLELFASTREGGKRGTLIEALDSTRTAMGSRTLTRWLGQPLVDAQDIESRLDRVESFFNDAMMRGAVRDQLREMPDLERIVGRITAGAAMPRDLAALRKGLETYPELIEACRKGYGSNIETTARDEASALLQAALADDPAPLVGDGGVIREGFSRELDEARELTGDVRRALAQLEAEERERSGIRGLRVAYNRVFGYYIEVSKANQALVPDDYQRKQTLVNAERYTTPRLKELEERILGAREAIGELEGALFRQVCAQLAAASGALGSLARTVAEIDVYSALAETAARNGYVRPVIDDGESIVIRDGRHPVVERSLGEGRFVPNDTQLDSTGAQVVVLTGPNMAGKSTYLRQVALIVLLAQAGSFVPASSASIGVVDRIFTRIGAQDDLARGESTFMVEMLETAAILRGATRRSLLLFDEVGRGTSTYDGLAIARAVVEYLHARPERAAKTLFATHYHEMTALADSLPRVRNQSVAVTEQDGTRRLPAPYRRRRRRPQLRHPRRGVGRHAGARHRPCPRGARRAGRDGARRSFETRCRPTPATAPRHRNAVGGRSRSGGARPRRPHPTTSPDPPLRTQSQAPRIRMSRRGPQQRFGLPGRHLKPGNRRNDRRSKIIPSPTGKG